MPDGLKVLHDGEAVPAALNGAHVAIGNFDGLHRGHQYLIRAMEEQARQAGRPAALLTFEPHPRQFFKPDAPFFRLTSVTAKEIILAKLGLDGLFIRSFNQALAALSAAEFISLLRDDLKIGGIVVGHDFHFGRNREGTPEHLKELCAMQGLDYRVVEPFCDGDAVVSSSLIRAALMAGDIAGANHLLGYRWFVQSTVVHGAKRGRELGFPTANLELDEGCGLRHGVYGVRVRLPDGRLCGGVASFGRRPMFDNGAPLLEVHLFDFAEEIYGQILDVELIGWIRDEKRFNGLPELIAAIGADAEAARQQLASVTGLSMLS